MRRERGKSHCPINVGLETFGDSWSLLVVRDIVYFGKHTFREFLGSEEAIAPSVLASRLARLEETGVLSRAVDPADGRKVTYTLTDDGLALIPVLLEIADWSARVDPDTDAPADWIETVRRNKAAVTELITATVRDGGSVFVGPGSVVERLAG